MAPDRARRRLGLGAADDPGSLQTLALRLSPEGHGGATAADGVAATAFQENRAHDSPPRPSRTTIQSVPAAPAARAAIQESPSGGATPSSGSSARSTPISAPGVTKKL